MRGRRFVLGGRTWGQFVLGGEDLKLGDMCTRMGHFRGRGFVLGRVNFLGEGGIRGMGWQRFVLRWGFSERGRFLLTYNAQTSWGAQFSMFALALDVLVPALVLTSSRMIQGQ